jgi:hypothetical protein
MTGGWRCAPLSAALRGVFSIPGSQFDFKVINLVPLGVGSLAIRYLKKLLQALTGRNRLWCIHEASSRSQSYHWYTTVTRP